MGFDDYKAQLESDDDQTDDSTDQDLTAEGDTCPEDGCGQRIHVIQHERNPRFDTEPPESYNEIELVCVHHGIVATP